MLDDADDLSTLPPDWRPDGASHIGAGLGEVRIAPGGSPQATGTRCSSPPRCRGTTRRWASWASTW
ncbi:MAG: hypothetical protein R2713_11855 [Ilumatobacteraceae bacterium]